MHQVVEDHHVCRDEAQQNDGEFRDARHIPCVFAFAKYTEALMEDPLHEVIKCRASLSMGLFSRTYEEG